MLKFMESCRFSFLAPLGCAFAVVLSGTAMGWVPTPITDISTGQPVMYPSYVTVYDGQLFFRGNLPSEGSDTSLWRSDGANAWRIADTGPGGVVKDAAYLAPYNGVLYFDGTGATGPTRLWEYSPSAGVDLAPGSAANAQNPEEMTSYNGSLYYRAARFGVPGNIGIELWKFDGTNQTPIDMFPGSGSSYPQHFIQYDGLLYFNACGESGQGTELWRTDGVGAPTNAATIYPHNGSSPEQFAVYDSQLYFSAYDGVHGRELWRYDGATASLAADIAPGGQYSSSNPNNPCVYNGKLYFSAADNEHGYELWSYDGASAQMVAEINPTPDPGNGDTFLMDSSPGELTVFDNKLYFSANDGVHGRELWSYDGSAVSLVADINPGQYGSEVSELTVFDNKLYFSADSVYVPGVTNLQPKAFMLAESLMGDTDSDGDVDFFDYTTTKGNFGIMSGMTWSDGDMDQDGDVDFFDYTAVKGAFGQGVGPAQGDLLGAKSEVPEPGTVALLSIGTACLFWRRRKIRNNWENSVRESAGQNR